MYEHAVNYSKYYYISNSIVHCSSDDPKKGWRFEFDLIFTETGLINHRYFVTKNIGKIIIMNIITNNLFITAMEKIYRREEELF